MVSSVFFINQILCPYARREMQAKAAPPLFSPPPMSPICTFISRSMYIKNQTLIQWKVTERSPRQREVKSGHLISHNTTFHLKYSPQHVWRIQKPKGGGDVYYQHCSLLLTLPKGEVPWIRVTCRHRWVMTHLGNKEAIRQKGCPVWLRKHGTMKRSKQKKRERGNLEPCRL